MLTPDPVYRTNVLLAHISHQLANASIPAIHASDPYVPTGAAIRVNVTWFLSLVLSIASAINATLFQQWSRRYLELTRHRVAPHKRARTRAYMFNGIASFKMSRAVKAMPIFLHSSIFLFFVGLIDFLFLNNNTVAIYILVFVSVFSSAYTALTLLPNLYLNCPYSTPVSEVSWRLSQCLLLLFLRLIHASESIWCQYRPPKSGLLGPWRKAVKAQIKKRREWLRLGLQRSIILNATKAPSTTDGDALSWTLTVLDDDREFEDFVARVPGFFESASVKDAPSVMLSLMNDQPSQPSQPAQFDPILGSRLNDLLKTCVPGISPLREEMRKNRLRVCMRTLWYFARQYDTPEITTPLPSYVRAVFAGPEMIRQIHSEEDIAARLIGRSFSSLIVKKLARDIDSHITQGSHASVAELSCIASILGKTSAEVADLLRQPGAIGLANFVSLTSSEMGTIVDERVPSEVLNIFRETLDILLAEPLVYRNADLPQDLVAIFHQTYSDAEQLQVPDWLMDRLGQVFGVLSMLRDEPEEPSLALPRPEPGSPTNTSNILLQPGDGSESPLLGNEH